PLRPLRPLRLRPAAGRRRLRARHGRLLLRASSPLDFRDTCIIQVYMSDAAAFMELARRIARGLASIEKQQVCCGTITLQQFDTLRALKEAAGLTTSAIAGRLGIDLSTASRNLTVLERQGYISRVRAAE